jgi:hypothetical protein
VDGTRRTRTTRETRQPSIEKQKNLREEIGTEMNKWVSRKTEARSGIESVSTASAYRVEVKSLVMLHVNCRSIYNKALEFSNLVDTYNPDVVIGTESWLKEDLSNVEVFRADFTIFRTDRSARGGGVFMCVKNYIACTELWVNEDF